MKYLVIKIVFIVINVQCKLTLVNHTFTIDYLSISYYIREVQARTD